LFQHPARPTDACELSGNGAQHAGDPWCLRIHHARRDFVEVGVAGSIQTCNTTAYLITETLVEFIETARDAIGARRGTLDRGVGIDQLARLPPRVGRLWLCFSHCP